MMWLKKKTMIYGYCHYDEGAIVVDSVELWTEEKMSGVGREAIVCLSGKEG